MVAVMAKQRRTDGAGDKADGVDAEGLQYPDQRIRFREIELCENERRYDDIEQEIVRFDNCPDCTGHNGAAQLPAVFGLR